MSLLVVGLSHKSAPVALLERAAVTGDALDQAAARRPLQPGRGGYVRGLHL